MKLSLATQELFEMTNMKDKIEFDASWKVEAIGGWTNNLEDNERPLEVVWG